MTPDVKLSPCPWCPDGGDPGPRAVGGYTFVQCGTCEATGPAFHKSFASALEAWNRRLLRHIDALQEQLAEARKDAERYRWFKSTYSASWLDAITGSDGISFAPCWELRVYLPTSAEPELDAAIDAAKEQV